jgi:hypothetical protein
MRKFACELSTQGIETLAGDRDSQRFEARRFTHLSRIIPVCRVVYNPAMKDIYWKLRESLRSNPVVAKAVYLAQSFGYWMCGDVGRKIRNAAKAAGTGDGVALCIRIRDEAPNLRELVEYYLAAGVRHIFFYEARSGDDFHAVLDPFVEAGVVTLIENWPHVPISPAAEHDCVLRCIGRFAWLGCIDADEFVVIGDGRKIDAFLHSLPQKVPALALHWRYYGSNGHIKRPALPVILAYSRRHAETNRHVKVFLRPERATRCRNSHTWFYSGAFAAAKNENGRNVYGSISLPPTSEHAWINHYFHKSKEEFDAKGSRASVLDVVGMNFNYRTAAKGAEHDATANAVEDLAAVEYHRSVCRLRDCSICAALSQCPRDRQVCVV